MSIAIIDYGSGNLRSAEKAFRRMAGDRAVKLTDRPEEVAAAEHIVLPGVGAFGDCRAGLDDLDGMVAALDEAVRIKGRPFLGICVGMQLMCARGTERGRHDGLGWIGGSVDAMQAERGLKVPHMGWNDIRLAAPHPVFDGLDGVDMYFVHSYAACPDDEAEIAARFEYGGGRVAALARETMVGTQFHPEKSQHAGLRLIGNFLEWRP